MKKRLLGKNKLEVSSVGLGCMGFSQSYPPYIPKDEAIAVKCFKVAAAKGNQKAKFNLATLAKK